MAQPLKTVPAGLTETPAPEGKPAGLALLRVPFPDNQVSKLPKGTKAQNDCPPQEKRNCAVCGGWHHPGIVHLDYVGHAALTDRLLEADPEWSWEPMALTPEGLPRFDASGGLWIRLTVCGVTRLGYGHAASKQYMDVGAREKEVIGDALRNAGIRFGAALDLWHKGDLHAGKHPPNPDESDNDNGREPVPVGSTHASGSSMQDLAVEYLARFEECKTGPDVKALCDEIKENWAAVRAVANFSDSLVGARKRALDRIKTAQRQPGQD